jgi:2-alkyl-3-oxoalkanoate reductase
VGRASARGWSPVKVLVTGATSLLLGRVARALLERGDEVVCLQRHRADLDVPQVLADIGDAAAVRRAAVGCDAVVHGAAKVGVVGGWDTYRVTNVDGTANVLDAMRACSVPRLVYVSSPSVAHGGSAIVGAGAEPAVTGRRRAWYAESKAIAEQLALAANTSELGVVAIRPHLVWGPGDTQLVGRIVERAAAGRLVLVGGGTALVDTTFVDNAVTAHLAALDAIEPAAPCAGRAYVIANGEPRPIRDLVAGICHAAGVPFEPRTVPVGVARMLGSVVERVWPLTGGGEPPLTRFLAEQLGTAHWFDPRPARDELGWQPTVSIDEGLAALATWFRQAPERST